MDIKRNHIITLILVLTVYYVYSTWDNAEHFKPQKWGSHYYYDNELEQYPITPSIVSYDISNYKLPKSSFKILNKIPEAHNIPTGETKQTAAPENINQVGAPLDEVMKQEHDLMQPLHEIRQHIHAMDNTSMMPEMKEENHPEITHEGIIQELHDMQPKLVQDLPDIEMEFSEKEIQKSLMPGSEHKKILEKKYDSDTYMAPAEITQNKSDYNMSLVILLAVLLIGFVYYTK